MEDATAGGACLGVRGKTDGAAFRLAAARLAARTYPSSTVAHMFARPDLAWVLCVFLPGSIPLRGSVSVPLFLSLCRLWPCGCDILSPRIL